MPNTKVSSMSSKSGPEIPGIKADHELAQMLRKEVAELLGRKTVKFLGSHPVVFESKHLEFLKQRDFYVYEKSNGTRCLLYLTRDGDQEVHYMIDCKNDYYWVRSHHFPMPNDETFRSFHTETLLDGELVLDDIGNGKKQLRYYVADCLVLDNQLLIARKLDKRIGYYTSHILSPHRKLCKTFPDEVQYFPFQIQSKRLEFSYSIPHLFSNVLPNLPHGYKSLIFHCRASPYIFGTNQNMITWKPVEEITVDFRLNLEFPLATGSNESGEDKNDDDLTAALGSLTLDIERMPTFNLSVFAGAKGYIEKWATMHVTPEEWNELSSLNVPIDGSIVECVMDKEKRWKYVRFRRDRVHGNYISVVNNIIKCLSNGVSKEDLIGASTEIRKAWKMRADGKPQKLQSQAQQDRAVSEKEEGSQGPQGGQVQGKKGKKGKQVEQKPEGQELQGQQGQAGKTGQRKKNGRKNKQQ